MKWTDAVFAMRYTDNRALAALMSIMWRVAAEHGDEGVLSTLQMNTFDCLGVANHLDWAGMPVTEQAQALVLPRYSPPVRLDTMREIKLG